MQDVDFAIFQKIRSARTKATVSVNLGNFSTVTRNLVIDSPKNTNFQMFQIGEL